MSFLQQKGKRISKLYDYSEIHFDDVNQVGSGGFGKVYAGFLNDEKIGIKKITNYENDPNREKIEKFIEREISILKLLEHPNVIHFYGLALKENSLFLLTELVVGGDLHWYIKQKEIVISWRLKFEIARDIASAMEYIHDKGIIHRDLKSTNLLVDEGWRIKICDMGLARQMDNVNEKKMMTICGSDAWMSPEVLTGESYDKSCDVFSFGMVLIELIIRENLTPRLRNEDLGIDKSFLSTKTPDDCPPDLVTLIYQCTQVKPSQRPSFSAIVKAIEYILNEHDFETLPLPPLRVFKPPELHIPVSAKNQDFSFPRPYLPSNVNNNTKNNVNNNRGNESFAFPVPYQSPSLKSSSPNVNNFNNTSGDLSQFSFPRPYVPSTVNFDNKTGTSPSTPSDLSHFSFPRPWNPDNDKGSSDESTGNEDENEEEEEEEYRSSSSKPLTTVISFQDFELLSFPRPWNPENNIDNDKDQSPPLLQNPDYSFPRPWNPDTEPNPPVLKRSPALNILVANNNNNENSKIENNNIIETNEKIFIEPKIVIEKESLDDSNNNKTNNNSHNSNNNEEVKVEHRRSRSLDFKNSTKVIIKKFEELTRFNSHNGWKSKHNSKEKEKEKENFNSNANNNSSTKTSPNSLSPPTTPTSQAPPLSPSKKHHFWTSKKK